MNQKRLRLVAAAAFLATAITVSVRATENGGLVTSSASPMRVITLRHDPRFILQAVAGRMGVELSAAIPLPIILLESQTPLARLQTAVERQWGVRPNAFVNAYAQARNEIYLIDDADMYERRAVTPDDSLAHELVHYLQVNYLREALDSDWAESRAVEVQQWFRRTYMSPTLVARGASSSNRPATPPRSSP